MLIGSPARTLVREQYPSIHGQRYLVWGSIRVLLSIQSRVLVFAFSRRIRSRWPRMDRFVAPPESFSTWAQPDNAATAPRPTAPLIISRRVIAPSARDRIVLGPDRILFRCALIFCRYFSAGNSRSSGCRM